MKDYLPILLIFFALNLNAQRYPFEQVYIPAIENPVYLAISPNGLKMLIIDYPRKGRPVVKQCNRPYIESTWGAAYPVDELNRFIDDQTRIDGLAFSFDNQWLYLAANFANSIGGMDIYCCKIDGNDFGDPINIGAPVNTIDNENFPSVSGNMRSIYFTREAPMRKLESFKTGELWWATVNDEMNNWNQPEKINTEINSGGIAWPKIYDDNKTLFYSRVVDSKEKWKIFWASKFTNIHWYLPIAFDTLKSKHSEISPFYCKHDSYLYYIVFDDNGFHPTASIYRYKAGKKFHTQPVVEIKGNIIDKSQKLPLSAKITVSDPVFGSKAFCTRSDTVSGNWRTLINANNTYMFQFSEPGYSHYYNLFFNNEMLSDKELNPELFSQISLLLNVYDSEEFWPLNGEIKIYDDNNMLFNAKIEKEKQGQFTIVLPIGYDFTIDVEAKDYERSKLKLDLTNIVLFDKFIRDIELKPLRRQIEFEIIDKETNDPLVANINIIDRRGRVFVPQTVNGRKGFSQLLLREGEVFDIEVSGAKGFAFKHHQIDLDANRNMRFVKIALDPLTRKVPIVLNNINFEFNSADLLESSYEELNRVVKLLMENSDVHTEIMAHTDDIGSDRYNDVLAGKRANSVVDYLIQNGIEQTRLLAKGYGKRKPLVPNTSDDNRARNRRVEMKIFDIDDKEFYIEERIDN